MNVPMSWLRACTDIKDDVNAFMEVMTNAGMKVEGLTRPGANITNVVAGKILSIEKHPNADKLLLINVDIGERKLQIVTGALNLSIGDYVPVALDGAMLAEGKRIKKGKIRGFDSEGMLCDITELGYTRQDYPEAPEDGIYIFQKAQPLGADVKPILEIEDEVVEFEIMSNRPDSNSILGMAREAAAAYGRTFAPPPVILKEEAGGQAADYVTVEIKNPGLCPRYIARIVKNIRIAPSPQWLRHRLTASGVRPINNIVDITNYVMLEYGQPLHAFDINGIAEKDGKPSMVIRNAIKGEKFTTLDGVERNLDETMLVIADHEKALAIAGVMGGANSMVTGAASTVLFESANFNGSNIRLTSRKLGLRTDASARFEKGLDPNLALEAVNRAMELIEALNCGEVVSGMADVYPSPRRTHRVMYAPGNINALLGAEIETEEIIEYLARVGIHTLRLSADEYEAEIPTWRADIACEADIAEEAARFYGYNNIPSRYIQYIHAAGGRSEKQKQEYKLKQILRALGYSEALTYPFESPRVFDKLLIPAGHDVRRAIAIQNPLGEDYSIMRTLTLDGLLQSLSHNYSRRSGRVCLFECAFTYIPKSLPLEELPDEKQFLTLAAYDNTGPGGMDFFDIKGDIEQLLLSMGCAKPVFAPCAPPHMHPGRTASVSLPGKRNEPNIEIGYIGELHPQARENYQIGTSVYIVLLDMEAVLSASKPPVFSPLPKFPPIQRDLALKVKTEVSAAEVESAILERGGPLLKEVKLFDVYQGMQIEEGYKSLAYTLLFRSPSHTLTDGEVQKPLNAILENLRRKTGAELRDR